jgi:hypothetical protein
MNDRAIDIIDSSLDTIIASPYTFGGYYAVETQVLRLLEVRHELLGREGDVASVFNEILDANYPAPSMLPIYVRVDYRKDKWEAIMRKLVATIRVLSIPWPPREVSVEKLFDADFEEVTQIVPKRILAGIVKNNA